MHSLALVSLVPLVAAHGFINSPAPRRPGDAFAAACGQQPFSQQSSDINGNVQGIMQVVGDDLDTAACNLWLCKGFQFDDNVDNVQSFSLGETIDFDVNIAAPHTGFANVSVVKTSTDTIIGVPLIEFENYASNAGVAANNTAFSVTLPSDLGGDCTTPGDCVLQWFWDAPDIHQTYESCVDFTVSGGSGSNPPPAETTEPGTPEPTEEPTATVPAPEPTATVPAEDDEEEDDEEPIPGCPDEDEEEEDDEELPEEDDEEEIPGCEEEEDEEEEDEEVDDCDVEGVGEEDEEDDGEVDEPIDDEDDLPVEDDDETIDDCDEEDGELPEEDDELPEEDDEEEPIDDGCPEEDEEEDDELPEEDDEPIDDGCPEEDEEDDELPEEDDEEEPIDDGCPEEDYDDEDDVEDELPADPVLPSGAPSPVIVPIASETA